MGSLRCMNELKSKWDLLLRDRKKCVWNWKEELFDLWKLSCERKNVIPESKSSISKWRFFSFLRIIFIYVFHYRSHWFISIESTQINLAKAFHFLLYIIKEMAGASESMTSCLKVVWLCVSHFYIYMSIYMSHMVFDYEWSYDRAFFAHSCTLRHNTHFLLFLFIFFFFFFVINTRLFNGTHSIMLSRQSTHAFASNTQL